MINDQLEEEDEDEKRLKNNSSQKLLQYCTVVLENQHKRLSKGTVLGGWVCFHLPVCWWMGPTHSPTLKERGGGGAYLYFSKIERCRNLL